MELELPRGKQKNNIEFKPHQEFLHVIYKGSRCRKTSIQAPRIVKAQMAQQSQLPSDEGDLVREEMFNFMPPNLVHAMEEKIREMLMPQNVDLY